MIIPVCRPQRLHFASIADVPILSNWWVACVISSTRFSLRSSEPQNGHGKDLYGIHSPPKILFFGAWTTFPLVFAVFPFACLFRLFPGISRRFFPERGCFPSMFPRLSLVFPSFYRKKKSPMTSKISSFPAKDEKCFAWHTRR